MKTYPALAFEHKDESGVYIGEFDGWCQALDEAILFANKDGSKPDKKIAKEIFLREEKFEWYLKGTLRRRCNSKLQTEWMV